MRCAFGSVLPFVLSRAGSSITLCRLTLFQSMFLLLASTSASWQASACMTLHLALLLSELVGPPRFAYL